MELGGVGIENAFSEGGSSIITGGGYNKIEKIEKKIEAGACFTWAGVHYKTFDGQVFSFGEYNLQ